MKVIERETIAPGVEAARATCVKRGHQNVPISLTMRDDGAWEEVLECRRCGRWRKLLTAPA
jgi:hypothetical protein